jgi:hypothetical protein
MDILYIGCEDMVWFHLAQDKVKRPMLVNMLMDLRAL